MSQSTTDKFWGWYAALAVIVIVSLGICSIIVDNGGRKDWNHPQAMPSGMTRLTKSAYLVDSRVGIEAGDICKGGDGDTATPDYQSVNVPRLHAVFVQCARSQTWNDHRELSPNFGNGIMQTLRNPAWLIPMGGLLLIFSIPPWVAYGRETRYDRRLRKQRRLDANRKRELLTNQWAKDEITDLEFENKLSQIEREANR